MTQLITADKDEEIRQYHRKRLLELCKGLIGRVPWLDEPTGDQKRWIKRKMKGPARGWEIIKI